MSEPTQIQVPDDSNNRQTKTGLSNRQKNDLRKALNVVDQNGNPAKYAVSDPPGYRDAVEANLKNVKWPKKDIAMVMKNLSSLVEFKEVEVKNSIRKGFKAVMVDDFSKVCAMLLGAEIINRAN